MLALGALAVSCTVGTPETSYNEDGTLTKIVNAPLHCDNVDGILVKFKDLPDGIDADEVRAFYFIGKCENHINFPSENVKKCLSFRLKM